MELSGLGQGAVTGVTGVVAKPASAQVSVDVPANALAPVQAAAQAQPAQPSRAEVEQAAQQVKASLQSSSTNLEFSIDDKTDRLLMKVVDKETQQVICQFPSKVLLAIARALDHGQGQLIRDKA